MRWNNAKKVFVQIKDLKLLQIQELFLSKEIILSIRRK
jgi:hypothetical protein